MLACNKLFDWAEFFFYQVANSKKAKKQICSNVVQVTKEKIAKKKVKNSFERRQSESVHLSNDLMDVRVSSWPSLLHHSTNQTRSSSVGNKSFRISWSVSRSKLGAEIQLICCQKAFVSGERRVSWWRPQLLNKR